MVSSPFPAAPAPISDPSGSFKLAAAVALPLAAQSHRDVLVLNTRIPSSIHGLFRVELRDGSLAALQIVPDAASDALNRLLGVIGETHRYYAHGARREIRYEGAELQALITTPPHDAPIETTPVTADISRRGYDAPRSYRHDGEQFLGSYRLCDAAKLNQLPRTEKQFLARVQQVVGEDLSGAFAFNLIEQNGKPTVDALFIAPNVVGRQLMEEVLTPIERSINSTRTFQSVGMRQHWSTFTIEQKQLAALKVLGDAVGNGTRSRV